MNPPTSPLKRKQRKGLAVWLAIAVIGATILGLTHDIIITNILAYRICHSEPQPKTFIKKTIEYPESIYWEDNIYPGFDEKDRLLMIQNYLDGVHLKIMGLNAPDGSVYIFSATPEDWQTSREIKAGKIQGNYYDMLKDESKAIAANGQHVSGDKLPELRYSVVFNPVSLTDFEHRYLWSDEVIISDNQKNEIIGFNRRLMHRWYMLNPDVALGNRYYYPHAMCGWGGYEFDDEVFPINKFNGMNHLQFVNNKLYEISGGRYGR